MTHLSSRLRRIVAAYTVNQLGNWFAFVALAVAVYDHTHSALATTALFMASRLIPALLAPLTVARLEAPGRRVLVGLYAFEGLIALVLAVLVVNFWLPAILLVVAVARTAGLAEDSLLRAAAAHVGSQDELSARKPGTSIESASTLGARRANAALNTAFTPTFALGPALAGALVAATGSTVALLVDAASFFICSGFLLRISAAREPPIAESSTRARLSVAWRHIRGLPALRSLLATEAVALVFFGSIAPIEVIYATTTLNAGAGGYGLLMGAWGVGAFAGSVIFARSIHRRLGPLLSGGALAVGVSYLGFAAAPTLTWACVVAVLGGIGQGVQWASLVSAVQQLTPSALIGRIMSVVQSMASLCPAVGFLVGGTVAALTSPRGAFWVAGACAVATTFAFVHVSRGRFGPLGDDPVAPEAMTTNGSAPRVAESEQPSLVSS